jgi:hypothetical protein
MMKSISFSFAIALLAFAFSARPATVTYTPGTGVLLYPENFFEANSNSIVQAIAGAFPGTGSGNASTNVAQGWSALQVFDDVTVTGTLDVGDLTADSFTTATPIGFASGGHGATNAAGARSALGVVPGTDVQAQSARLQELADISYVSGDFVYYDGANLVRIASTAAGLSMLTAADAAAQWALILPNAVLGGGYNSGTFDGVTNKAVTADQMRDALEALPGGSNAITSVTAPLELTDGVLSIDTSGLGGGGGFTYILTNSLGAWQGRDTSTNWTILSTTISSNDLPTATGKFIEGGWSLVASNYSGTTATLYLNVLVGGTLVFSDSYSLNSVATAMRPMAADFRFVRESESTASLVHIGQNINSSSTPTGIGDFSSTASAATIVTTNITVDWTGNLAFAVEMYCDTSTSTNAALGIRPVSAWMRRDATASSGTGDVVGPASSTTNNIAVFADATGKLLADGGVTVASLATEAEVAAGYEPLNANKYQATNSVLTTLGTLDGAALTNLNASGIASGTLSSNRLPADVSFTTIDVGAINATSVVGDASGLTGINATNITAGELADARIPAGIARTNAPTLHSPVLLTPTLGVASATSLTLGETNVVTELALKAPLASPVLTGTPTVNGTNLMAAIASAGGGDVATDSIWTTKGDLAVGTGTATAQRLGVGTQGQTPLADTNATAGISWGTPRGISTIRNFFLSSDFAPDTAVGTFDVALPWKGGAISGGSVSLSSVEGLTNHWGVARVSSAAGANSGWKYALTQYGLQIGGQGEQAWHAWRPVSTNNGIISKIGFIDSITTTESTDAVAFMRTNNLLIGVCRSNNIQLQTASTYTIASNAWYYAQVEATAPTTATFRLYGDDWTLLWSDTVTGGIPLGRSLGHGYVGFATNAVGVVLDDLDFFSVEKQNIR